MRFWWGEGGRVEEEEEKEKKLLQYANLLSDSRDNSMNQRRL